MARFLLLPLLLLLCGCRSYNMGNQCLFAPDIQTVSVSIAKNNTWRRGYGERLTEAVVREIENRTPFKVVPETRADTILSLEIVGENKTVTFEDDWADPRELALGITIKAQWMDRRTRQIRQSQDWNVENLALEISSTSALIAEAGQSNATSSQKLMEKLAQQIVGMMEKPW